MQHRDKQLRHQLLLLSQACGVEHPAMIRSDHFEFLDGSPGSKSLGETFGYSEGWTQPPLEDRDAILAIVRAPQELAAFAAPLGDQAAVEKGLIDK